MLNISKKYIRIAKFRLCQEDIISKKYIRITKFMLCHEDIKIQTHIFKWCKKFFPPYSLTFEIKSNFSREYEHNSHKCDFNISQPFSHYLLLFIQIKHLYQFLLLFIQERHVHLTFGKFLILAFSNFDPCNTIP